jgi:hypothetical protein
MLCRRLLLQSSQLRSSPVHVACVIRSRLSVIPNRSFTPSRNPQEQKDTTPPKENAPTSPKVEASTPSKKKKKKKGNTPPTKRVRRGTRKTGGEVPAGVRQAEGDAGEKTSKLGKKASRGERKDGDAQSKQKGGFQPISLKEALLEVRQRKIETSPLEPLHIEVLESNDLDFKAVHVDIPAVPKLSYGLDRVLFNPGVYLLRDPSSRVYNFDPYLEKIMAVKDFDFDALSEYKTSSKDQDLLAMTERLGTKFTGSTSSMSGTLQHFHFLLSSNRKLNHSMLSKGFPSPNNVFSKVTTGPDAIIMRYKNGQYAIDADKSYDSPNIMSWLGHSMEKLLTTDREEFERYRRSSPDKAPKEDSSSRCYHYSTLGNILMRSQLDAHDPRLPGTGIFDLKTRAVVSIRMDHKEFETGSGYQIHHNRGEWESFEREFYDMTRATMLKYSLQVRMGRMNGIFLAYHNIERIFGFQYLSLSELDEVLHGQKDTCLGDQEFKLSIRLLDEILQKATAHFPDTVRNYYPTLGHTLTRTVSSLAFSRKKWKSTIHVHFRRACDGRAGR